MFIRILLLFVILHYASTKKSLMPKIEISMLLDELTSEEADKFLKRNADSRVNVTVGTSTEANNGTSSDEENDSTTDLIEAVTKKSRVKTTTEAEEETTTVPDYYEDPEEVTTPRPMLLSEFARHLTNGLQRRTTTTSAPITDFPKPAVFTTLPDETFPFMVSAAKEFIQRYLSPEQWKKLKILLKTIREVGGSRQDIHRAATVFISKVISKSEMDEITERKRELFRTFNRRYFGRRVV